MATDDPNIKEIKKEDVPDESTEITEEDLETDEEQTSQLNGEDTLPDITHEFGVILLANLDGKGVQFQIVPPEQGVGRIATPEDMMAIIGLANVHMQGNIYASKFLQAMQQTNNQIKISKRMPYTGPRR